MLRAAPGLPKHATRSVGHVLAFKLGVLGELVIEQPVGAAAGAVGVLVALQRKVERLAAATDPALLPARVARDPAIVRHVLCHQAAGTDQGVAPYGDAAQENRAGSNPRAFADERALILHYAAQVKWSMRKQPHSLPATRPPSPAQRVIGNAGLRTGLWVKAAAAVHQDAQVDGSCSLQ